MNTNKPWTLKDFVRESNSIEGINREPASVEIAAHKGFLSQDTIEIDDLRLFVTQICGAAFRNKIGMDIRVGAHVPLLGGPLVPDKLGSLLSLVNLGARTPHEAHKRYEIIHPFMDGNGRSGRVLWLWMMGGEAPIGFLHQFYYQTLEAAC